ncbi:MAG TPA: HD domain-containing phosphohydrolase [Thermodesulfovibrionales bacterium]|nr:HD domain-containing phosphohydrolase [Thermodesulfovibrionales bacterium]
MEINHKGNPVRILLIEDDPGDVRLLQEMLRKSSPLEFDCATADSLTSGLGHLEKNNVDVVLLDLGLPETQELETLARVVEKTRLVPIVVLTGLADETQGVSAISAGAQDYLIKGQFDGNILSRSIRYSIKRKRSEERLKALNQCFLAFGTDPVENINRLVSLCGKLLGGTCALYNRLHNNMLCSLGLWNVPPDYNPVDAPGGHICHDVITSDSDDVLVIRNLSETRYAQSDPNVARYKLQTYIGMAVHFGDVHIGSLCVVYQEDFVPSEGDKYFLGIIASAIGVEEKRRLGDEALAASERKYRRLHETMRDAFVSVDMSGRITDSNKAYREMIGYSEEELLKLTYFDLTPEKWHPSEAKIVEDQVLSRGYSDIYEKEYRRRDGTVFPVELRTSLVRDNSGKPVSMWAIVRDITERKEAEETLLKLFHEKEEEAEISKSLLGTVEILNSSLDERDLIQKVINLAPRYVRFDTISIFFYDDALKGFTFAGGYGLTPAEETIVLSRVFRKGDFPAVDKALNGETIILEDVLQGDLIAKDLIDTFNLRSLVVAPIQFRNEIRGAVVAYYRTLSPIHRREVELLKGLADGIAIALQNSRLYRESVERMMELSGKIETIETMAELDREILSTIDRNAILKTATLLINRVIPSERTAIILKENAEYRVVSEWGLGRFVDEVYPLKGSHFDSIEKGRGSLYAPDISHENCPYHRKQSALGIKAVLLVPILSKDGVAGLIDIGSTHYGRLTPEHLSTAEKIASQIAVALENARLYEDLEQLLVNVITSLASAIDAKSPWTRGHSERVTRFAMQIGREMGLTDKELETLKLAGLFHDVGKIGTYDMLLDKTGKFTDEELAIVREHPAKGAEILSPIRQLKEILPGVLHHHERVDGKGYPEGLKDEEIPLCARILCVADSFDAMTADRPYRPAPGREFAISELKRCAGTQFDAKVAEAFLKVLERSDVP